MRWSERQLEAARARLAAAEAGRYPTFGISGSLDAQSDSLADLLDVDSVLANLVSGLTAPIFESGRIRRNIDVREAQWEQAALAYRGTVLQSLSEVERALSFFYSSRERIAALEEAARRLGAAPQRVFRTVVLPQLRPADLDALVERLTAYRLLRYDRRADHYTTHPLVRNH